MSRQPLGTSVVALLDPDQRRQVEALIADAAEHDGISPVNEAASLDIRSPQVRDGVAHLLTHSGADLVGYMHLDSVTGEPSGQLVVAPAWRGKRVANHILGELGFDAHQPDRDGRLARGYRLTLWAFGDQPSAQAWAARNGYHKVRELLIMERDLTEPIPDPAFDASVTVRPFADADAEEWLRVNARAFAHHPEQGAMTAEDLAERLREPWFDRDGFLVATKPVADPDAPTADHRELMIGFHWTKLHSPTVGEVYVIAVDPDHGGGGLGRNLLYAGLRYLKTKGAQRAILYVESDLKHVVELYLSAIFIVSHRDALYAPRPDDQP